MNIGEITMTVHVNTPLLYVAAILIFVSDWILSKAVTVVPGAAKEDQ